MNLISYSFTRFSLVLCFLVAGFAVQAQTVQFLSPTDAITTLDDSKSTAETQLNALSPNAANFQQAAEQLEFEIGVAEKMTNAINDAFVTSDPVKAALVSLLEALENAPIGVTAYGYYNQAFVSPSSTLVNNYVLGLLKQ